MTEFASMKTKAANAWDKTLENMNGIFGLLLGSILAFGILAMGLTLGLMALGLSAFLMLIALPLAGLNQLRGKTAETATPAL